MTKIGRARNVPTLLAKDWLLAFLLADGRSAIQGRVLFQKMVFLFGKEVVPEMLRAFRFHPYKYGPYSSMFEAALNSLVSHELVFEATFSMRGLDGEELRKYNYMLSPEGRKVAKAVYEKISTDLWQKLTEHKKVCSAMGYKGVLSYVYREHPEYTKLSEINPLD